MSPTRADLPGSDPSRGKVLQDLAAGLFALACAAVLALHHFGQSGRLHEDFGPEPGPAMLPELLLVLLAANGLALLLRSGWSARRANRPLAPTSPQTWRTGAVYGALITFAVLQGLVGFALALCALGAALPSLLSAGQPIRRLRSTTEGLALSGAIYAVFRFGLGVPLT